MLNTDQKILFEILIKLKEKLSHRSLPPKPSLFLSIESIEIRILVFNNKMWSLDLPLTDLRQRGRGREYEEGRGPAGTEPSMNLRAWLSTQSKASSNWSQLFSILIWKPTERCATTNGRRDVDPLGGSSAHGRSTRSWFREKLNCGF